MKKLYTHLISDGSGQTVQHIARAAASQIKGVEFKNYVWPMIRSQRMLNEVIEEIKQKPGIVIYTVAEQDIRESLKSEVRKLRLPCVGVVGKVINEISRYLDLDSDDIVGHHVEMGAGYFERVDAIEFSLAHDDGQNYEDLEEADIVIIGPSRTSKSPTCIFLAYNGYKAANIPLIYGQELPKEILELEHPLIVGLTINPERLIEIRKNRLASLYQNSTDYTDIETIMDECKASRRLYSQNRWPVIDVTQRSIEETSACIIRLYYERKKMLKKRKEGQGE